MQLAAVWERREIDMDAKVGAYMQHFCNQYAQNSYTPKTKTSAVYVQVQSSRTDTFTSSQPACEESKRNVWHSNDEINRGIAQFSHMGYENGKIFTNDGEFKFGKDFDPNLFKDKRYVMRGSISFVFQGSYNFDKWLEDEELF